jgi:hypothetical protein
MPERTCSIVDCDTKVLARGWCQMHYMRWRSTGDPGPAARLRRPAGSFGKCAADDCANQARRNGLCSSCSAKARRTKAGSCTINGCPGRADARGLCGKHYQDVRNGHLDHPAAAEILRDQPCAVEDCSGAAYARGFCNMHWGRYHRNGEPGEAARRKLHYEPGQTCAIATCPRPARWAGYCASHCRRFRRVGITEAEVAALLTAQRGRCAICKSLEPTGSGDWHIDHDHTCCPGKRSCGKCVRGLLCSRCNVGIGCLQDDPKVIAAALRYIKHHRQAK